MADPSPDSDFCASCVYWREDKEPGSVGRCGDCRKNPPVVMLDSEDVLVCAWPYTDAKDWCGDFRQKTQ